MAWLQEVPDTWTLNSRDTQTSIEDRPVSWINAGLSVTYLARITTTEVTTDETVDGIAKATAEAWLANNPTSYSKTYGTIQLGEGVAILTFKYVASETTISYSISRANEADGYRISKTTTAVTSTVEAV